MRTLSIAVLLSLPLAAVAAEVKVVSDRVKVDPRQEIQVRMDAGELAVEPAASGSLSYQVEYVPKRRGFSGSWFGPRKKDYARSTASFDPQTGVLTIHSGDRLKTIVKIGVPAKQELDVQLAVGKASIGRVAGRLKASVDIGDLTYDSSALASNACVAASLEAGQLRNKRGKRCPEAAAVLRARIGSIVVN